MIYNMQTIAVQRGYAHGIGGIARLSYSNYDRNGNAMLLAFDLLRVPHDDTRPVSGPGTHAIIPFGMLSGYATSGILISGTNIVD